MPFDNVQTGLPEMAVKDGTTFTVTCDQAGSQITQLVVHGWLEGPAPDGPVPLEPVLAHEPV